MTLTEQDTKQLNILSILHFIWGGLSLFGLLSGIGCVFAGSFIQSHPTEMQDYMTLHNSTISASVIGQIYLGLGIVVSVLCVIYAILNFLTGFNLRKPKGYVFTFVISILNCFSFPLGTALGVFTLIVINRATVKPVMKGANTIS